MGIQTFDSFDDMMAAEGKAQEEAAKRIKDFQRELKPGDKFIMSTPHVLVFGEVLDTPKGEDGQPDEWYSSEQGQAYRFCKSYSMVCPRGELGDIHISRVTNIITEETFQYWKREKWDYIKTDTGLF